MFEEASPFIKFALGENVKQSNWGSDYLRCKPAWGGAGLHDHFYRAREYDQARRLPPNIRNASRKARRNNTLPAARAGIWSWRPSLVLNEERFVTCHSYRQDEINMLMHVADSMGFTINTFTFSRATRWPIRWPNTARAARVSAIGGPTNSRSRTPSRTTSGLAWTRHRDGLQFR